MREKRGNRIRFFITHHVLRITSRIIPVAREGQFV
jgi:hypothetical protein